MSKQSRERELQRRDGAPYPYSNAELERTRPQREAAYQQAAARLSPLVALAVLTNLPTRKL